MFLNLFSPIFSQCHLFIYQFLNELNRFFFLLLISYVHHHMIRLYMHAFIFTSTIQRILFHLSHLLIQYISIFFSISLTNQNQNSQFLQSIFLIDISRLFVMDLSLYERFLLNKAKRLIFIYFFIFLLIIITSCFLLNLILLLFIFLILVLL